jgi:hypothetical protein
VGKELFRKFAPMSFRKFQAHVREYGCSIERTKSEWKVLDRDGLIVSTFAVTHGKNSVSNEVKPIYIKQFMAAIRGEE